MNKTYLLFDIDGTLINSGGAGKRALGIAFEQHLKKPLEAIQDYSFAGKTDKRIITDIVRMSGINGSNVDTISEKIAKTYIKNLLNTLKEAENFRVYPNVDELLRKCSITNLFETALLTGNIERGAELKLSHAKLWHFFEWGVFGDIYKDRNQLANHALELINQNGSLSSTKDIFVIGDTVSDIRCGKAINATTVAIVSDFQPEKMLADEEPDYLVHNFFELEKILI